MLREPDLITVETSHVAEVRADHAFIYLRIEGSAAFSSKAVANQSKEVAEFLERLTALGVPTDAAEVTGVEASASKEGLRRSSMAVHHVRIRIRDLKQLPSIIGLVPQLKQVELQGIEWGYDSLRELRLEWLKICLDESRKKAAVVVDRLDQRLGGVHRFSEKLEDHHEYPRFPRSMAIASLARGALESPEPPHVELSHTRRVILRATVSYLVSPRA